MNEEKKISPRHRRFFIFLKKLSLGILIISGITFLEIFWSMGKLSDQMSSGCLECSFTEDALFISLITGVFLSAVFALFAFIRNLIVRMITELIILLIVWLFFNYSIFVERESSWSTYSFNEELYYTLTLSVFPVIITGITAVIILHFKEIKARFARPAK
ncbi:MAG: hypothetical protein LBE92_05600 [Chryseobacterium sp.]|jgi:hypothetical protein|uniref:hypothetical protein n=1 Tax=Chryseobacterium sp. TaxID=1871047 RepID=UPI0028248292|nr:hypothetical protein [Chryseobacterium sp.]MDR2235577.1 hypothetical protein [Chryseobacterium sp.]